MLTRGLPRSVGELLARFRGCFTTPTFQTFTALVVGFWAQRGPIPSLGCSPLPAWPASGTTCWPRNISQVSSQP